MQTKIPPQLMGRVFSVLMVINGLASPLAIALFGSLGDLVKIETILIVTGTLMVIGSFFLYGRKELIQHEQEYNQTI
jgi:DHA3 family macrolide efflux protein-like MFS transporter